MSEFILKSEEVIKTIKNCKAELLDKKWKEKRISDVYSTTNDSEEKDSYTDIDGNKFDMQYVDLVMEGGGVLGYALVGYTYFLEEMGIRFLGLGGTSAGAINAMLLACLGPCYEKKSERILEILNDKESNLLNFVDVKQPIKFTLKNLMKYKTDTTSKKFIWIIVVIILIILFFVISLITYISILIYESTNLFCGSLLLTIYSSLIFTVFTIIILIIGFFKIKNFDGLNRGDAFKNWLQGNLCCKKISDIEKSMKGENHKLFYKGDKKNDCEEVIYNINKKLAIIAAEIKSETMVRFPIMGPLFFEDINEVEPAELVRMSMSIPLFFKPVKLNPLPKCKDDMWKDFAGFGLNNPGMESNQATTFPKSAEFVDGGILSNFPIDCFHRHNKFILEYDDNGVKLSDTKINENIDKIDKQPHRLPTFGIKLGVDRNKTASIKNIKSFLLQIFNSSRHLHNYDFILNNPDYQRIVGFIDTKKVNWLNFDLTQKEKELLFKQGVLAAKEFLLNFKWKEYKEARRETDKQYLKIIQKT